MASSPKSQALVQPGLFVRPQGASLEVIAEAGEGVAAAIARFWARATKSDGRCLAYPKPDGLRMQAHRSGSAMQLFSRNGKAWTAKLPGVAELLREQIPDTDWIVDLEVVSYDAQGGHLESMKYREAAVHRCYLLDLLCYADRAVTELPAHERLTLLKAQLQGAWHENLLLAEYRLLQTRQELEQFYSHCLARREKGFDGAIVKQHDAPYFSTVWKLKPEDTLDIVVIGAYRDDHGGISDLLLAAFDNAVGEWRPLTRASRRTVADWDGVWQLCQAHLVAEPPERVQLPRARPQLFVAPGVLLEVRLTEPRPPSDFPVRPDRVKRCRLREDKPIDEATAYDTALLIAKIEGYGSWAEPPIRDDRHALPLQLELFSTVGGAPLAVPAAAQTSEVDLPLPEPAGSLRQLPLWVD
jgi:ATP-dependent DNA ligase